MRGLSLAVGWAFSLLALMQVDRAYAQEPPGAQLFQQNCAACHSLLPNASAAAPSLFDIVGRKAASRDFPYSAALKVRAQQGLIWDETTLKSWILRPAELVPGTSMGFAGMRSSADVEALILFLKSNP
ncbi:MAG TPA: c-type cytochrome [Steroidobacteraceae bacterium]